MSLFSSNDFKISKSFEYYIVFVFLEYPKYRPDDARNLIYWGWRLLGISLKNSAQPIFVTNFDELPDDLNDDGLFETDDVDLWSFFNWYFQVKKL